MPISDSGNYSARLPRLLSRAICINIREAAKPPAPKPTTRNRQTVPSFVSIQYPATPGRTITSEVAIIRQAHSYAFASTERSSGGFVTKFRLKMHRPRSPARPRSHPQKARSCWELTRISSEISRNHPLKNSTLSRIIVACQRLTSKLCFFSQSFMLIK